MFNMCIFVDIYIDVFYLFEKDVEEVKKLTRSSDMRAQWETALYHFMVLIRRSISVITQLLLSVCLCVCSGTGNTVIEAVKVLIEHGVQPRHIILLSLFSTPHGRTDAAGRPRQPIGFRSPSSLSQRVPQPPRLPLVLPRRRQDAAWYRRCSVPLLFLTLRFRQQSFFFSTSTDTKLQRCILPCRLIVLLFNWQMGSEWAIKFILILSQGIKAAS